MTDDGKAQEDHAVTEYPYNYSEITKFIDELVAKMIKREPFSVILANKTRHMASQFPAAKFEHNRRRIPIRQGARA